MQKYIAFLRAINVGGTTIIKMTDLKQMFESFGLENVETYIQTGNVIFGSQESDTSVLEEQIERQLEIAYGKRIQLFVRTIPEVVKMVAKCPFQPQGEETAYIAILQSKPARKNVDQLMSFRSQADDFSVIGKDAYILRRDREKSIFSNHFVEKILDVPGTTRNLTTMKKLAEKYQ